MVTTYKKIRLFIFMGTSFFLALMGSQQALAKSQNCGPLTLQQRGSLFADEEGDQRMGFYYPAGTRLVIDSIEGDMARVTWPSRDGKPSGEAFLRGDSFDRRQFATASARCAVTQNFPTAAPDGSIVRNNNRDNLRGIDIQTNDNHECLPPAVKAKLNEMESMGWQVQLKSAHRSRADNSRRGGARKSLHIQCRAADFTVSNVGRQEVERYLISSWSGGLGLYCSGRFHIDNGNHRMWGGCASSKDRRAYYSRGKNNGATRKGKRSNQ